MSTLNNWQTICHQNELISHAGVCALLANEQQVAIFQLDADTIYALGNWDPIGQANVLSRGIIGDDDGELFVSSPLYKQRYALACGRCLDNASIRIPSYPTRIHQDYLQVQLPR